MYYGPERLRDLKFLREQDIVLTTYPTLTNDYSRVSIPGLAYANIIFIIMNYFSCNVFSAVCILLLKQDLANFQIPVVETFKSVICIEARPQLLEQVLFCSLARVNIILINITILLSRHSLE